MSLGIPWNSLHMSEHFSPPFYYWSVTCGRRHFYNFNAVTMIRLSLIFIKLFLTLLDLEFFSLFYILLKLFVRGPLISGGAVMCRLWVNKVKDWFIITHCGYYLFSLWLKIQSSLLKSCSLNIPLLIWSARERGNNLMYSGKECMVCRSPCLLVSIVISQASQIHDSCNRSNINDLSSRIEWDVTAYKTGLITFLTDLWQIKHQGAERRVRNKGR